MNLSFLLEIFQEESFQEEKYLNSLVRHVTYKNILEQNEYISKIEIKLLNEFKLYHLFLFFFFLRNSNYSNLNNINDSDRRY